MGCVLDIGAVRNLLNADLLGPNWQDSIRQRDMLHMQIASLTKLKLSRTITSHLRMSESRSRVYPRVLDELLIRVL